MDHNYRAVIADYGIADFFVHSDFTSAKSTATVRWTAPEVIAIPPDPNIRMDKVDVFALGMTMLEVCVLALQLSARLTRDPLSDLFWGTSFL